MNECSVCGKPTTGVLCRQHESDRKRLAAAQEARERDEETLAMMAEPGMNASRLAVRVGISRPAARHRVLNARRRQALLAAK